MEISRGDGATQLRPIFGTAGQQVGEDVASEVGQVACSTGGTLPAGRERRMLVAASRTEPGAALMERPRPRRTADRVVAMVIAR